MNRPGPWIQSAPFDLPLIALAPLLGLVVAGIAAVVGEQTLLAAFFIEANFFLLGMPHYLSTYVFYLDDESVRYHSTRRLAFYAGPVIVAAVLTAAMLVHLFILVAVVVAVWNVFHVSRQSSGILSVYRHRAGGDHAKERLPAVIGLLLANLGMFAVGVARQPYAIVQRYHQFAVAGAIALLVAAGVALLVLGSAMLRRGAHAAEWVFVATSVLLFAPFLTIRDMALASTAMLSGHFVQYMGLVWLLNHRRFRSPAGSMRQRALAAVSQNAVTVVSLLVVLAIVPFLFDRMVHHFHWMAFHAWWLNVIVLLHFYLDGLFWAFRDPHVRRTIGPYLVPVRAPLEAQVAGAVAAAS